MTTMANESTSGARTELQAWYLRELRPKLARAAQTSTVDPRAVAAFDAELRAFLDLPHAQDDAA